MKVIRVWDLPLRLFHWSLAILVAGAIGIEKIGGDALAWHFRAGYAILALLVFRVFWGTFGTRYARFSSFLFAPSAIFTYATGRAGGKNYLGHNPIGSLSVFALLAALLMQVISGLFSNDDIASEGPWVKFISKDLSDQATWLHAQVGSTVIYALLGLHVAAILYHVFWKKDNLVKAMITGDKPVALDAAHAAADADDSIRTRLIAAVALLAATAAVYFLVTF